MAGTLGRLVPWASWDEWRQVGNWLFSSDLGDVRHGISRVAAWRVRGRLPLGVDITACLVETRTRDLLAAAPSPPSPAADALSDSQLRLQYAMTLVRMVNGIADSAQKGRVAASVASLAAAAGLPRILVDLRHESTHNELPSAASLRLAAEQALGWLQLNYWQRQAQHLEGCRDKVQELVQEFISLHAAAAAKVASHTAEQQLEEDDQGPPGKRSRQSSAATAAAAAAAAAVATGKKGGGRNPAAAQPEAAAAAAAAAATAVDPAVGSTAAEAAGGYSAAEGQRRRRALLSELKMGVPRPAASLLVEPVLAAGISPATLAAAGGEPAALERALATSLPHFVKEWPQLPGMLLHASVEQLVACAARAAGSAGSVGAAAEQMGQQEGGTGARRESEEGSPQQQQLQHPSPEVWLAWVSRLLPPPPMPAGTPGSASKPAAAAATSASKQAAGVVPGWAPSAQLLRELVAACLPALLSCAHRSSLEWVTSSKSTSDGSNGNAATSAGEEGTVGAAGPTLAALRGTLQLLTDSMRSTGAGSAALARCTALAVQAAQLPAQQPQHLQSTPRRGGAAARQRAGAAAAAGGQGEKDAAATVRGGPDADAAVSQQMQQLAVAAQQAESLLRRKLAAAERYTRCSGAKRWRRAASWAPCALGNLPSAGDPNGCQAPREQPAEPAAVHCAGGEGEGDQHAAAQAGSEAAVAMYEPRPGGAEAPQAAVQQPQPPCQQQQAAEWAASDLGPTWEEEWPLAAEGQHQWAAPDPSDFAAAAANDVELLPQVQAQVPTLQLLV